MRDGRAERGDLRERQIHEDHAAFDDVHAQIGVDAGQNQAGDERRSQELEHRPIEHCGPDFLIASTNRLIS